MNVPLVMFLVPVAPAFDPGGPGTAMKLNVPETLDDVSDEIVTDPLPRFPAAAHAPVTVVPDVVMKLHERFCEATVVVPTAAVRTAKPTARVRSELFDAMLMTPFVLVAVFTAPV